MSEKRPTRNRNSQRSESNQDQNCDQKNITKQTPKNNKKILVILSSVFLILLIAVGGVAFLIGKKSSPVINKVAENKIEQKEKKEVKVFYYTLTPGFAIELRDLQKQSHFLQATICLTVSDENVISKLKAYDPIIRNSLLELLGSNSYESLSNEEGKEKLRSQILTTVQTVLNDKRESDSNIKSVLVVDYVME